MSAFLALLPCLPALSYMDLTGGLTHHAPTAAAYSALTANDTTLKELHLSHTDVPAAAWQHIFRGRPQLHDDFDTMSGDGDEGMMQQQQQLWQLTFLRLIGCVEALATNNLQALAHSCPHLQHLQLNEAVQPAASFTPLLQLTQLTWLLTSQVSDQVAKEVLTRLTGLSQLAAVSSSITDVGVLHLTALRQLTSLFVMGGQLSSALLSPAHVGPSWSRALSLVSEAQRDDMFDATRAGCGCVCRQAVKDPCSNSLLPPAHRRRCCCVAEEISRDRRPCSVGTAL